MVFRLTRIKQRQNIDLFIHFFLLDIKLIPFKNLYRSPVRNPSDSLGQLQYDVDTSAATTCSWFDPTAENSLGISMM